MTGAACILGCAGPLLSRDERAFFRDARPWGFILFARNVADPAQLTRLTADLRETVGRDAPVLVDQEGGRVQRLRPPYWRDWPAPLDAAESAADPVRTMWLRGRLLAHELRAVGIDANCAPCCDIARFDTHPFLRNRCLGTDADSVAARACAMAEGLLAGGVLPILKHIPGHGRATADSHHALPVVTLGIDALAEDFAPFRALRDMPMAMTAHVRYAALDNAPGTVSEPVIDLVRNRIGFDGLLMTDDLSMNALGGTIAERAARAIAAGCDIALHCNGDRAEAAACVAGAGALSPAATRRADAALARRQNSAEVDIAALEAELAGHGRARPDDPDR
ncbi:Beta-N-acetylhexosaminidase [Oceaniovalibus guishaninsula JLT2003]|uniref:beta-N-acetylhexosaminidase n=1 Tax=Oceaniovalibus guishaninsula JLT2003 TaxID=1231392 RepID=K2I986_9RHOB|nr:glycoside hydrolase family 3 N-terminal domain-containing protein [Oceaniovalibus guishaninsula]EKE45545.1 Beta-N-acetylhexosaminidase [Oceaniovalibus guishaninsula JLT2003]